MKALLFHLMPCPALDERFDDEAHSAWVDLDPSFLDAEVMHRAYNTYLDQLEHAAAAGFDGICVNEHHQSALRHGAVAQLDGRHVGPQHRTRRDHRDG